MDKKICFLLALIIILMPFPSFSANELDINGEGAILIDANNSQVLYEKNSNKQLFPASTTKIMTGILALELGNLDDIVTIDNETVSLTQGSHIALEPGEQLTLEQLLNALLIGSANDAAFAIAKHISGDIDVFVSLMNEKAKELGAKNTNFVNPNGLHDDNHVSTAYDLAKIGQYAMRNEIFRKIVGEYTYIVPITNKKNEPRFLKSANRLIYSTRKIDVDGQVVPVKYDGATGIKTGFTKVAQSCLVSSVEKNNQYFIAVVLNSTDNNLFVDTHKLYNYGFKNFFPKTLGYKNEFIDNYKVMKGISPTISAILPDNIIINAKNKDLGNIEKKVIINEDLTAPINIGDQIGKIQYIENENILAESNIVAAHNVEIDPNDVFYKRILSKWYLFIFLFMFLNRFRKYVRLMKIRRQRNYNN